MKKILCGITAAIIAAMFPLSAAATSFDDVDVDYNGLLGSYYDVDSGSLSESQSRIAITPDVSYDSTEDLFYYYASDIAKPFTSNVMDGMITTSDVTLTVPQGIASELYRDGQLVDEGFAVISEPGDYVLRVKSNSGVSVSVLSFRIVGKTTCELSGYSMPDGFVITGVTLDGKPVSFRGDSVEFTEDGKYSVKYRCSAIGVDYSLDITTDRSSPELKLEGVKNGQAWGPVDISDLEAGGTVTVYRNGEKEAYTPTLTKSGQYEIIVKDAAGNKTSYSFTIMIYFNSGSIIFFVCVAVIIAAVTAYIIISGKKLRVR